ncbi:hypothetical protein CcaverHIS002_0403870 [Cutaneotrichosporon cavernicola]|uniref:Pali-domain-containing protein n=1 Tax=Cutaneotrichosporon cavernicola TaxID=279322 RepID=A0AA48QVW0_9TREE|nr:uncharacterized protein CcaverHIS019_0403820 [Cutaneotrichosporon cavernicola]BEI83783.1 hypothetical protein CcaverHIS002_0403870 [Cutaneotrichosporon cavernicola]BEI91562.1 hypothetical protein CcaverHIS019_0403820 [Cutaneotrichosporon cavernicola]BEI99339.1 hypothetical protein CcaverHIS631_0403820 [Cutaneotrichosporon cavernicola]BEJ07114.1 hypothetical protein CcaverHIS641_0403830 [Cutaneotrichosporon cavernicola]
MTRWERSKIVQLIHSSILTVVFTLLLLATISTPITGWSYLTVEGNGNTVTLGTFGWCRTGGEAGDYCSRRTVGYDVQLAVLLTFPEKNGMTVRGWYNLASNGLLAVAITCALAGLGALTSITGKTAFSLIWSSLLGILTSMLAAGCLGLNVLLFGALKRDLLAGGATSASYGKATYFVFAAAALSLTLPIMVAIDCCSGMIKRWRHKGSYSKLDQPRNTARESTYRSSDYELPVFDDQQTTVSELGPRKEPSGVRTAVTGVV